MADYFEERGIEPLADGEEPDNLLHYARLLREFRMYSLLGDDKRLPPPAAKEFLKSLKKETVESKEVNCPVCLIQPDIGEIVTALPCTHKFHFDCISPWLERTSTCPVCRHELPTDDQVYEMYKREKLQAKRRKEEVKNLLSSMFT